MDRTQTSHKQRLRRVAACATLILIVPLTRAASVQSPYATQLIAQNGIYGPSPYDDPNAVLGEPTSLAINNDPLAGTGQYHIKIIEAAANLDPNGNKVVTTLARASNGAGGFNYGSITVKFDHPIYDIKSNPYGIDLNVFGNDFYTGSGSVSDTADMRNFTLTGGSFDEPVVISVSPDNSHWYTYSTGPFGDTPFPTQGYVWSATQFDQTGNGWTTQKMDFTKPVNPTLAAVFKSPPSSLSAADVIGAYVNSGGGTGIDLAPSGFSWIQYARVESTAQFRNGEIDAFAAVRPMTVGDALSITPDNVQAATPLYFQNPADTSKTSILAQFTSVSDLAKVTTGTLTDSTLLSAVHGGSVASAYTIGVSKLIGDGAITFSTDFLLSPGLSYTGNGADLTVLSWDGTTWQVVPSTFDTSTGLERLTNWQQAFSDLVLRKFLAGDVNEDGRVNADDYWSIDHGYAARFTGWNNGDLNGDGTVNGDDYFIMDSAWSAAHPSNSPALGSLASVSAVPEPTFASISLVGISLLLARRKARHAR